MSRPPLPSRERRVRKIIRRALLYSLLVLGISVFVWLLRNRAQGETYAALNGSLVGWLTVLPIGVGTWLYRAYRSMDEFGQRLQERACALAFIITLLASLVVISTGTQGIVPLWLVCLFGLLAYVAALLQSTVALKQGRE